MREMSGACFSLAADRAECEADPEVPSPLLIDLGTGWHCGAPVPPRSCYIGRRVDSDLPAG
jgi:hypothetical protein